MHTVFTVNFNFTDPETEEDRIRADMIEQQIVDMRSAFAKLCYNPEFVCKNFAKLIE